MSLLATLFGNHADEDMQFLALFGGAIAWIMFIFSMICL